AGGGALPVCVLVVGGETRQGGGGIVGGDDHGPAVEAPAQPVRGAGRGQHDGQLIGSLTARRHTHRRPRPLHAWERVVWMHLSFTSGRSQTGSEQDPTTVPRSRDPRACSLRCEGDSTRPPRGSPRAAGRSNSASRGGA